MSAVEGIKREGGVVVRFPLRHRVPVTLLIALRIDNRREVEAAFGEAVALEAWWSVYDRVAARLGAAGSVTWDGPTRLEVTATVDALAVNDTPASMLLTLLRLLAEPVQVASLEPGAAVFVRVVGEVAILPTLTPDAEELEAERRALTARLDRIDPHVAEARGDARRRAGVDRIAACRADMAATARLFDAMSDGRLALAWQPVVAATGPATMLYRESLLRLVAPNGEGQSVAPLIAAAERSGLMRAIDAWVVDQVIVHLAEDEHARLACNISAQSAVLDGWWGEVLETLAHHPDIARRLVVEITETADFPRIDLAVAFATHLRALGVSIAIDDFGAGRAALRDIVALDPAIVKIDAAFLRWASVDGLRPGAMEELRHLIALAGCRGREVVMEGVETEAMRAVAVRAGARWLQGAHVGATRLCYPTRPTPVAVADVAPDDAVPTQADEVRARPWPLTGEGERAEALPAFLGAPASVAAPAPRASVLMRVGLPMLTLASLIATGALVWERVG